MSAESSVLDARISAHARRRASGTSRAKSARSRAICGRDLTKGWNPSDLRLTADSSRVNSRATHAVRGFRPSGTGPVHSPMSAESSVLDARISVHTGRHASWTSRAKSARSRAICGRDLTKGWNPSDLRLSADSSRVHSRATQALRGFKPSGAGLVHSPMSAESSVLDARISAHARRRASGTSRAKSARSRAICGRDLTKGWNPSDLRLTADSSRVNSRATHAVRGFRPSGTGPVHSPMSAESSVLDARISAHARRRVSYAARAQSVSACDRNHDVRT